MPKLFRVLVIDPSQCSITATQSDCSAVSIHALVHAPGALGHFRIADHETSWDYGWCDDTALARGEPVPAFLFSTSKDPIGGRCILAGMTKEGGETCDAKFPIDVLRDAVTWLGMIRPEVTWDSGKDGVTRSIVTYEKAKS